MTSAGDDGIEAAPSEIVEHAAAVGTERLDRSRLDIFVTSIIGGAEVSLGGLAAMTVIGATMAVAPTIDLYASLALAGLVFPIGFVFVIIGRSELFTENFLIPVVAVVKRDRTVGSLFELWTLSWIGNMLGCAGTAALLLVPGSLGEPIQRGYVAYTEYKLSVAPLGVLVSAMLAGGVMTTLTWALLAVKDNSGRAVVICAGAYVLMAANLSHSIVSASVLLVGFGATQHGLGDVLGWLLLATAGNLVGGIGLVTLFRLAQTQDISP
jgi:formate/nitrite transporter FocA (FNT family)